MISSQSYSEPVPLDYELNKCFSGFFFPPSLRWNRMLELSGVGYYLCTCVCVCAHTCMHTHVLSQVWFFVNPMDYSPPGSSVHGIFQAAILEWLPFPFPRDLLDPGIKPASLASAGRFFTTAPPGKPQILPLLLFSRPVMFNSLWPNGLQHARPPCLSPSPEVCQSSCPLHQWCHPAISSSDTVFSFSPQSFPASGSNELFFQWVGCSHQMTKILEHQHQSFQWVFRVDFRKDWLLWSPCCPRDFQEFPVIPQFEGINSLALYLLYSPDLTAIHDHWEDHRLTIQTFVGRVMSMLFHTLSRFVTIFLPRSNRQFHGWSHHPQWF